MALTASAALGSSPPALSERKRHWWEHQLAARVRAFVDFVALSFSQQAASGKP